MKQIKGFSIVELLTVVSVIGVLATGLISLINPSKHLMSARSSSNLSNLRQINDAIEAYSVVHGFYPIAKDVNGVYYASWICANCSWTGHVVGDKWLDVLKIEGFLKTIPLDSLAGNEPFCKSWGASFQSHTGYLYRSTSDGYEYKLLGLCAAGGLADPNFVWRDYCVPPLGSNVIVDPDVKPPGNLDPIWGQTSFSFFSKNAACYY